MARLALLFLISLCSFQATAQKSLDSYDAKKVAEHTYVIHGSMFMPNVQNKGFMNNPAFIVADKGVIIVDPGSTEEIGRMVLRKIKAITDKPVTHVFNTHIHGDHWLSNDAIRQAYPDIIVMADARMIKKAKAGEAQNWIDLLDRLTEGASRGTKIMYPNKVVSHEEEIKIHNFTFKVHIDGKAHSDSDIMIEFIEDDVLFTGDITGHKRILRMDDGGFRDMVVALDMAIKLNNKVIVPGHGPTGDLRILKLQKEYITTIYKKTEKYYAEGLQDFEMKSKITPALTKFESWTGFDEQVGKHISLGILEIEQAEFE